MTDSTAINAQGSTLKVGPAATPALVVGNLKTFSGFDGEAAEIDTTHLSSTGKEYMAGLQDFGGFNVEWDNKYGDEGQDHLRTAQGSGSPVFCELTLPNGDVAAFKAIVKNAQSISGGVDAAITGGSSFKISGAVVITVFGA